MQEDNYKKVNSILLGILFLNLFVAIIKIVVGTLIFSASLTADGYHSLSDGISNIVGIIGVKFASMPDDEKHPYGHNKLESFSGIAIGLILFYVGYTALGNAYDKFINPTDTNVTFISIVVLVITLIINLFITTYESKKGVELNSTILLSDANHTKSDIFISCGVLITLIALKLGADPIVDPIVTVIVSVFIFYAGWEVFYENASILIDTSNVNVDEIKDCVMGFENVKGVHYIRSRGTNNRKYIDMHILVDPDMTVSESHDMQHDIEIEICKKIGVQAQVIIHVEPFDYNREKTSV